MNSRRDFLGKLGLGIAAIFGARALAKPTPAIEQDIVRPGDWPIGEGKVWVQVQRRSWVDYDESKMMVSQWFQTPRTSCICSVEYQDALDVAMGVPEPRCREAYIRRRVERSRRNLAELKLRRPLPI